MLLISSSAHRIEVCVLVVALCGFPCSTHTEQRAPTQQPDVIAAPVKEQLLPQNINHVFFCFFSAFLTVWIKFYSWSTAGKLFRRGQLSHWHTSVHKAFDYLYFLCLSIFSSWLNVSRSLQRKLRLQASDTESGLPPRKWPQTQILKEFTQAKPRPVWSLYCAPCHSSCMQIHLLQLSHGQK